jgi:hypothetical protein
MPEPRSTRRQVRAARPEQRAKRHRGVTRPNGPRTAADLAVENGHVYIEALLESGGTLPVLLLGLHAPRRRPRDAGPLARFRLHALFDANVIHVVAAFLCGPPAPRVRTG